MDLSTLRKLLERLTLTKINKKLELSESKMWCTECIPQISVHTQSETARIFCKNRHKTVLPNSRNLYSKRKTHFDGLVDSTDLKNVLMKFEYGISILHSGCKSATNSLLSILRDTSMMLNFTGYGWSRVRYTPNRNSLNKRHTRLEPALSTPPLLQPEHVLFITFSQSK